MNKRHEILVLEARDLHETITSWRRELHRIPETGVETPLTEAFVCNRLDEMGISYRKEVGGHGVVALIDGNKPGPVFAIRADMDGLPITEETGLPFASTNGCMHACGHDAHAAMGLGAAALLTKHRDEIAGQVKIIFQPGEEGCPEGYGGAKRMLDDGAMQNPRSHAMVGLHTGCIWKDGFQPGEVGIHYGGIMACMDRFELTVRGKGSHGAYPHGSVDPISIAVQIIGELQTIVSRELDPLNPAVLTIGEIHAGTAFNIIPGECRITGTVRALDQETRQFMASRIEEMAHGVAASMRGNIEFRYGWEGPAPVVNDPEITQELRNVAEDMLGPERVKEIPKPSMGGEDIAFFMEQVPGTFFFLPGCDTSEGEPYPHHNSRFDIDESVLWIGPALFAGMAMDWLEKHSRD